MRHYLQIKLHDLDDPKNGRRLRAFTFAHCPECRLFWPNVAGRVLIHVCPRANDQRVQLETQLAYEAAQR